MKAREGKVFFSEEKKQKTFNLSAAPTFPAMAGKHPPAPSQKSFASFLQKRRLLPFPVTFWTPPCAA
jgi:hypothetical protein